MQEQLGHHRVKAHGITTRSMRELSSLDGVVANFALTGATWYFGHIDIHRCLFSLQLMIDRQPHRGGRLGFILIADHPLNLHGRLRVVYGSVDDPGVDVTIMKQDSALQSTRTPYGIVMDPKGTRTRHLYSSVKMAPQNPEGPCMAIQVNQFLDGFAVAVQISHSMADATTLVKFMQHWGSLYRNESTIFPGYDPQMIQTLLADNPVSLRRPGEGMSMHRYDYYQSKMNAPAWADKQCEPPVGLDLRCLEPSGEAIPWHEWQLERPVSSVLLQFSPARLAKLCAAPRGKASHHDVLLAYIWTMIQVSRGLTSGQVFLDCSIGLRSRLGLPDDASGSPMLITYTGLDSSLLTLENLQQTASLIRKSIHQVTKDRVLEYLSTLETQSSLQRYWDAFLGGRHVLATSWIGTDAYSVVFDEAPLWVRALMSPCDGLIQLMDSPPSFTPSATSEDTPTARKWYDQGCEVSVFLDSETMKQFILLVNP